ncbi:unnamed protein product [Protopolystoma xenopodis]|uniref:Uncharacterized protein n=1 Tax=Protopolystoma xenopodis TaxID=117903 RepID=A0A448WZL6_9PLAT|nr:unnamed protein product [Protopolystoma xenopodis]
MASWGIFDWDNTLRQALAGSLHSCEQHFYPRWRDYETVQAASHYTLDEEQYRRDWDSLLTSASQPRMQKIFSFCTLILSINIRTIHFRLPNGLFST